jgi:hypothetical protein
MSRTRVHLSGWETGFFRVAATPESGNLQVYRNKETGAFTSLPYDHAERQPESDWEPIYVYRGNGSWMSMKVAELRILRRSLGMLLWRQDHKGEPERDATAQLLGRITRSLAKGQPE